MQGIYSAAIVTTALAVAIFGTMIGKLRLPANPRLLWLAFLIVLPLQPAAFYFVRVPLDHWLTALLGRDSATLHWLVTFYAPLTEEPAKLVPLLVPAIRRDISRANLARYALAIGLGFAIGEMWFVAEIIARNSQYAGMPFYVFGGYLSERLMVCLLHSAFVGVALACLRNRFAVGVAGAMALHWLGNFPIFLMATNAFGMGPTFWAVAGPSLDHCVFHRRAGPAVLLRVWAGQSRPVFLRPAQMPRMRRGIRCLPLRDQFRFAPLRTLPHLPPLAFH